MKLNLNNQATLGLLGFLLFLGACTSSTKSTEETSEAAQEVRTIIEMQTTKGTVRLALYNETPKHRDNFTQLVREGAYDSLLFHRVIESFMIQGGDP